MAFSEAGKIWLNGTLVDWWDARLHVASHAIHYGSGVFEGIRCYATEQGSVCFRLDAHIRRLLQSATMYRMESPLGVAAWTEAVLQTIRANRMSACYIRPLLFRGSGALGVNPADTPVCAAVLVWEWGTYGGQAALEEGVDMRVSSWRRPAPNTLPALAKCAANYANSALARMEAIGDGYSEGLMLDADGHLSEGAAQNVFAVHDGVISTPPIAASILAGITRDTVITLARQLGLIVKEVAMPRESLYCADEVFCVGTAAEIAPVRTIDGIVIGKNGRGPVTSALQRAFFSVIHGEVPDRHAWLTAV